MSQFWPTSNLTRATPLGLLLVNTLVKTRVSKQEKFPVAPPLHRQLLEPPGFVILLILTKSPT